VRGGPSIKTGHAAEQDRPDVLSQREAWFDGQFDLDPARLMFSDETWTAINMTRSHGRCRRSERLRMGYPHGHRKTTTLVAGLRMTGMVAPMVLDGPINGDWFEAYVGQVLVPELRRGDVVVMDMCGRPRGSKQNLRSERRADRVLTCVRPLVRPSHAAGPYGSSRIGAKATWRAWMARVHELADPTPSHNRCAILSFDLGLPYGTPRP